MSDIQANQRKSKIFYNFEYLCTYCNENNIELLEDYSNQRVARDTIIRAKCVKAGCLGHVEKTHRMLVMSGCYCKTHATQNKTIKQKATFLINYGVPHPLQRQDIRDKKTATFIETYGVANPSQVPEFQEKKKATSLENHGVEHPSQSQEIKDKIKATSMDRFGYENPAQNAEVAEKASKNAYKAYDYIFPSGRVEKIQGYEKYMLDELLQKENIPEDDIVVKRSQVPEIWFTDENNTKHRYFVDCLIKSQKRCIEAKSTWTAEKQKDCIFLKQQALKDDGYECEIWVYNDKGEKVNCYK